MSYVRPGVYITVEDYFIKAPRDLREEFLNIKEKFLYETCTRQLLEEMNYHYSSIFRDNGLEDLRFKLEYNDKYNGVNFIPIRPIDKLAIEGILAMPCFLTRKVLIEKIQK